MLIYIHICMYMYIYVIDRVWNTFLLQTMISKFATSVQCFVPQKWSLDKKKQQCQFCDVEEVRYLVGSYILTEFDFIFDKRILSLYKSDGLFDGVFRILTSPEIERRRKEITKICKHCDLSITRKTILKVVDFEFR